MFARERISSLYFFRVSINPSDDDILYSTEHERETEKYEESDSNGLSPNYVKFLFCSMFILCNVYFECFSKITDKTYFDFI